MEAFKLNNSIVRTIMFVFIHWGIVAFFYWATKETIKDILKREKYGYVSGVKKVMFYIQVTLTIAFMCYWAYGAWAWGGFEEEGIRTSDGDPDANYWIVFYPHYCQVYTAMSCHNKLF